MTLLEAGCNWTHQKPFLRLLLSRITDLSCQLMLNAFLFAFYSYR